MRNIRDNKVPIRSSPLLIINRTINLRRPCQVPLSQDQEPASPVGTGSPRPGWPRLRWDQVSLQLSCFGDSEHQVLAEKKGTREEPDKVKLWCSEMLFFFWLYPSCWLETTLINRNLHPQICHSLEVFLVSVFHTFLSKLQRLLCVKIPEDQQLQKY